MSPQLLQTSTSKASLDSIRRSISSMLQHAMPKLEGVGGGGLGGWGRRGRENKRDKRRGVGEGEIERVRETRRAIIVVSHQPHNYGLLRANPVAVMST